MVKVKGLFKKPWERDLKKDNEPVVNVRDSFGATGSNAAAGRVSTYEYYEDNDPQRLSVGGFGSDGRMSYGFGADRFSLFDDYTLQKSKMKKKKNKTPIDRDSMLKGFKQDSLYFDEKIKNQRRSVMNELRLSTGIVNHEITKDQNGNISIQVPERRLKSTAAKPSSSSSSSRGRSPNPSNRMSVAPMPTMVEGEEEEESSDDEETPRVPRSISPVAGRKPSPMSKTPSSIRPGLTRNNSWTSTRDMDKKSEELMKKKKKKVPSSKNIASRKKRGNGSAITKRKGTKKRTTSPGSKKEGTTSTTSTSPRPRGKPERTVRGASGSPKRDKPKRNRSSSPGLKSRGGTRPGLMRRNSWTSNSNLKANTGGMAESIALGTAFTIREDAENENEEEVGLAKKGSRKKVASSTRGASGRKKTAMGDKKKSSRGTSPKRRSGPSELKFMAGLRKSRAISHSICMVQNKGNVDKAEMTMLQKQLQEAMEETMRLKEECDKDKQSLGVANEETDELQQMLAESAKENMELVNRLEVQADNVRQNNQKVDKMTHELELIREEKASLAETVAKRENLIETLESEIALMRTQGCSNGDNDITNNRALDRFRKLKNSNQEHEKVIDDYKRELQARDSKIRALEEQLSQGPQGDAAKEVVELKSALDSIRTEIKQTKLERSVELAKKDATVIDLQKQIEEEKLGVAMGQETVSSLEDDLATTKAKLNAALAKLEESKDVFQMVETLENRVKDAEAMEQGLQGAIDKWTDKAFMWQGKAEALELEVEKLQVEKLHAVGLGNAGSNRDKARDKQSPSNSVEGVNSIFGLFGGQN